MTRFTRALTVLALVISLLVLPATADASPRHSDVDRDSYSFLLRLWERVSLLWGAGGGSLDPSGVVRNLAPTPAPVVSGASSVAAGVERQSAGQRIENRF